MVSHAYALNGNDRAVLIYVRTVEGVKKIVDGLRRKLVSEDHIAQLTGTIRGKERDRLVEHPVFKRFLPAAEHEVAGTVYLVCTSAGEVGVNLSADDLVCDLSPFDSMAQRFGRVNRFGKRTGVDGATVTVVHATAFDINKPLEERRERTLELLKRLAPLQSVSPNALGTLPQDERERAFTPTPDCLPLTDILIDAWSLTSILVRMPGDPRSNPTFMESPNTKSLKHGWHGAKRSRRSLLTCSRTTRPAISSRLMSSSRTSCCGIRPSEFSKSFKRSRGDSVDGQCGCSTSLATLTQHTRWRR